MAKKKEEIKIEEKFIYEDLDELMGDRFGRYSKYIIQDRALPDIRDGLKPVQRRILFAMHVDNNTHQKPYRKSAKTVGTIIGNYHPHGDSSVYEAMVRLSQSWKMRAPLIDMQGNNGSIDNDSPAAMRYTEARLAVISSEMLKDLDRDTVEMTLNYDDKEYEPTVLPAKYPNLLVNGSKGIAAGYATEIPPHNLGEVIDATIYRIKNPKCSLEELMEFVKGPDLPTGAIIQGKKGIIDAYKTGKGRIIIRSRTEIKELKDMKQIVVSEIPYEVVKSDMVRQIDEIRFNKEIDGILEVRDESDKTGLSVVIDIKKEANAEVIINYLMKNTDLQVSYSFNMVVIDHKTPVLAGLERMLDSYIEHQKDVLTRRTKFDLSKAKDRLHILEGLIIAINNLDEVISIIRKSHDKSECKTNIMNRFLLTEKQAEAIVTMQLYRLSSTDVDDLIKDKENLSKLVVELQSILDDEKKLKKIIIKDLNDVKDRYPMERLSTIEDEISDLTINKLDMVSKEDVMLSISRKGYIKRSSIKSYSSSEAGTLPLTRDEDMIMYTGKLNTIDNLLVFTNKGNYAQILVNDLSDTKWKDVGVHISNIVNISGDELIVSVLGVKEFKKGVNVVLASSQGMIKKTPLEDFKLSRTNKTVKCIKLGENDSLVGADFVDGNSEILVTTKLGGTLRYFENEVSSIGIRAAGVKAIGNVKKLGEVASLNVIKAGEDDPNYLLVTEGGCLKVIASKHIPTTFRTSSKTTALYKCFKSDPHELISLLVLPPKTNTIRLMLSDGTSREETFDMKPVQLDKVAKANINLPAKVKLVDATFYNFNVIDTNTPVYEESVSLKAKKEEIERAKDHEAGYKPISFEDIFDEFK